MAKRCLIVTVFLAVVAGGVFAQTSSGISGGGGILIGGDYGGSVTASGRYWGLSTGITAKTPYIGGGGFAFLDFTYFEISFGIFGGFGTVEIKTKVSGFESTESFDFSIANLNFGFLAKYPISNKKSKSVVFPLLGIEYQNAIFLKVDGEKSDDPGDFSTLWFKLGLGVDVPITEKVYIRSNVLFGIRPPNKSEKDLKSYFEEEGYSSDTGVGIGLNYTFAIGYRF